MGAKKQILGPHWLPVHSGRSTERRLRLPNLPVYYLVRTFLAADVERIVVCRCALKKAVIASQFAHWSRNDSFIFQTPIYGLTEQPCMDISDNKEMAI